MKTLTTLILSILLTSTGVAQEAQVFEYLHIGYVNSTRTVSVSSTVDELRTVPLKDLNGKGSEKDLKSALAIVKEYEAQGWHLFDFESDLSTGAYGHTSGFVVYRWLMRKKAE